MITRYTIACEHTLTSSTVNAKAAPGSKETFCEARVTIIVQNPRSIFLSRISSSKLIFNRLTYSAQLFLDKAVSYPFT